MPMCAFTHLEKIWWPKEGYTKGDVIAYYRKIAPLILPHLKDRPLSLNRTPEGLRGKGFYQKNVDPKELPPFAGSCAVRSKNGKLVHYVVCNNKETLLWLVNYGCIEFNPWLSRLRDLKKPNYLIIDIDPGKNNFDKVIEVAREVKRSCDARALASYPKTSGKSGMHIYVPLAGKTFEESRALAQEICAEVVERLPALATTERVPRKRRGKIYLDAMRNAFGQTCAAPYSLRPYPGATVSTPLAWREVKKGLSPAAFTLRTAPARFAKKKNDLMKLLLKR